MARDSHKPVQSVMVLAAVGTLLAASSLAFYSASASIQVQGIEPSPIPTYDPLELPVLPENPNESQMGKYLYYYHCMPCHGDLGQGLTDDFRRVWEEDHQNCWGRGCHGGRQEDEGFPIPTFIPGIISKQDSLLRFREFDELKAYLHDTHPPQYPGRLAEDEYQALAAYLWDANQKPTLETVLTPTQALSATLTLVRTPTVSSTIGADPTAILQTSIPVTQVRMSTSSVYPTGMVSNSARPVRSFFLAAGGLLLFLFLLAAGGLFKRRYRS